MDIGQYNTFNNEKKKKFFGNRNENEKLKFCHTSDES